MRVEFIERWPDPTVTGRTPVAMAMRKQKKWFVRMYGNKPSGPVVIASSIGQLRDTESDARRFDAKEFPWVALIDECGNPTYPYFDERKAKVKADARARQERRQQKAVNQLNLLVGLSALLGGDIR